MTLLLLAALVTPEWGRLLDHGSGAGTEFLGVVTLFPLLPAGRFMAFMTFICIVALKRG
jgi:hypothetical protein